MKKTYLIPEAMILTVAAEDIVRTSPLSLLEGAQNGYDDKASIGSMFPG